MANHKSAKKRARQALKRNSRNRETRSEVRTAVKKLRSAIASGDGEAAGALLRRAESVLRRAGSKKVLPKRRVSRSISRLSKAAGKLQG